MKTTTTTDLFFTYLFHRFNSAVLSKDDRFNEETMVGTLYVELDEHNQLYATPYWSEFNDGGQLKDIQFMLNDDKGNSKNLPSVSYPLNRWTMDPQEDAATYIDVVNQYRNKHSKTIDAWVKNYKNR